MTDQQVVCRCGHDYDPHDHYRPGTDCASCPPGACPRWRPPGTGLRLADVAFLVRTGARALIEHGRRPRG